MADSKRPETGGGQDGPGAAKGARPKAQDINLSATDVTGKPGEAPKSATATDPKPADAPKAGAPVGPKAADAPKAAAPEGPKTGAASEQNPQAKTTEPSQPKAVQGSAASPASEPRSAAAAAAAAASIGGPRAGTAPASSANPQPPRPPIPSRPARDGVGPLGMLFAIVAGASLAVLAIALFQQYILRYPAQDLTRVMAAEQKIDGLSRDLGALNQRVTELAEASDAKALAARVGALDGRVGALDSRVGGYDARIGTLGQTVEGANGRMAGLEAEIKGLRDRIASLPPDPAINILTGRIEGVEYRIQGLPTLDAMEVMASRVESAERRAAQAAARDDVVALAQRIAAVGGLIDPLDARVAALAAALKAFPKGDPAARLVVAIASLDRALAEGRPFTSELTTVKTSSGDSAELSALDPHAASGLPTREALSEELAASVAKLEPIKGPPQGTILERFVTNAGGVLSITSKDAAAGSDPAAVRARLASLAGAADIEQALALRGKLDEAGRAATEDWSRRASARVAAENAVGSARTAALARLAAND